MKKVLTFSLFAISILLNFNAHSIMYRPPPPPDGYDERTSCVHLGRISDPDVVIGFANIQEISTSHFGDVGSCYKIKYSATQSLYGELPAEFEVSACDKNLSLGTLLSNIAKSTRPSGIKYDINVLVGLEISEADPSNFKFLQLGCKFFPHVRVETLHSEYQDIIREKLNGESPAVPKASEVVIENYQWDPPTIPYDRLQLNF